MNNDEGIKIALLIRVARAAVGMSQVEMAKLLGISKVTLARVETLETPLNANVFMTAIREFEKLGLNVDSFYGENITLTVQRECIDRALANLKDDSQRRSDRKVPKK